MDGKIYEKKSPVDFICIYEVRVLNHLCDTQSKFLDYLYYIYG